MANETLSRHFRAGAFVGLAIIGVVAILGYLVWAGKIAGGKPVCEVCRRIIHSETAFKIARPDGSIRETCCPRCGLAAVIQSGGDARSAVDFTTRKSIRAEAAVYLEGSDIMECCSTPGFRTNEGAYREIDYDRCVPSLLAFTRREDAEGVRQKHGGQIITFEEARRSVMRQLKNQ